MKFATWDENLASHTPEVQGAARALEAVIREALPDVVVRYDPEHAYIEVGPKKPKSKQKQKPGQTDKPPPRPGPVDDVTNPEPVPVPTPVEPPPVAEDPAPAT